MTVTASHRDTCRLCDSANVELVIPLSPIPVAEKYVTKNQLDQSPEVYPVDVYICVDCGHVQLLDLIDPEFLWGDYSFRSGQARMIVEHLDDCAAKVCRRYNLPADSLVVDVGSNDGTLLRSFKSRGMRVLGIDPAREIAREATASGIYTIPEFLTLDRARQVREEHGPAAVVTCFNAFAHTDDMDTMAKSIRHMMDPESLFVCEVSYVLDIIDHMLLGTIFHEHLGHHSVKPLRQFLARHGMEMIDVERVPVQGGSFLGTAQLNGGPHRLSPSVAELLELERQRGLDRPETIRTFSTRLDQLKKKARRLISEWQNRGATIAGYGAARSGPTLIAELGLGEAISFIVDDHPQKVNRYTPGHHLPVLPTDELCKRNPDYCFILAWVHAKKIIANNRQYLEQGGHFVLCCPKVEVIGAEHVAVS